MKLRIALWRVLLPVTCVALVITLLSGAASGQTKSVKDRRDSYGMSPKVEAPKDIRRARFSNRKHRIIAVVRLRRLWRGSTGWTQVNLSRGYSKWYSVTVVRRKGGRESVRRNGVRRCPKLHARYVVKRNRVRFSIPQRCLRDGGRHRWQMSAYVGGLPIRDANAWDGSRSVGVRYR